MSSWVLLFSFFYIDMKQQVISFNCEEYSKLISPKGIEEDTFHY